MKRTYKELKKLKTFKDRFDYLKLNGVVGQETFGFDRFLNQEFFHSNEWRRLRRQIIIRDEGCDLGILNREIRGCVYVHHMNPIRPEHFETTDLGILLNPDNLICVSFDTHQAIHYGDESLLPSQFIERTPGDTRLW